MENIELDILTRIRDYTIHCPEGISAWNLPICTGLTTRLNVMVSLGLLCVASTEPCTCYALTDAGVAMIATLTASEAN